MTKCPLCEIRRAALKEFDDFLEWLSAQPEFPALTARYSNDKILLVNKDKNK